MGTANSYDAPRTPEWRRVKAGVTRFTRNGGVRGGVNLKPLFRNYVTALGGAAAAARTATAGTGTAQRFASFLAETSRRGLTQALQSRGLADYVGRSATEVLRAIADDIVASDGSRDEAAARRALEDVESELLQDVTSYDELERKLDPLVAQGQWVELLRSYLTAYIFYRMMATLKERIRNNANPRAAAERERELREFIDNVVQIELSQRDPTRVDWSGDDGREIVEGILQDAYRYLGDDDDG